MHFDGLVLYLNLIPSDVSYLEDDCVFTRA